MNNSGICDEVSIGDNTDNGEASSVVEDPVEEQKALRRSWCSRGSMVVYFILFVAGVACALVTYFLLTSSEHTELVAEFNSFARETHDISELNADKTFGQLKSLATAITSAAVQSNATFPNFTMPHFDIRTKEIAELTGAEMILYVPFVDKKDREGWEQYYHSSVSSANGVPENIYNVTLPPGYSDLRRGFVDDGFMELILTGLGYDAEGFSAPVSQFGPPTINNSLAMMDLFSHPIFKKEIISSLEYDVPVISEIEDLNFLLDHVRLSGGRTIDRSELRSFTFDQVKAGFEEDSPIVGYVVGVVPWSTFFSDFLPEGVNGIVVKVVSDCGRNFTYIINGDRDDWAADGQHYDSKYADLVQEYQFFWKDHAKGTSRHCHFDLHMYPSQEFANVYYTNDPIVQAGYVLIAFTFAAILFFVYDWYVQKHQRKLAKSAERATNLVTSLFPKKVGEQLMEEADKQKENAKRQQNLRQSFLASEIKQDGDQEGKPLADLYENTTIMFADIVGFTAWSSTREPWQVFHLLETVYKNFDLLAYKMKVFKIETVGDCYVAVCGLPDPQPNHAIMMARFAQLCISKFNVLCSQLEPELGHGTTELGLRVGLNSGSVTAGVLRGDRARFQLFGDTMNTASRMESNGAKNRVHISQATADLLIEAKKAHWIEARKDKIFAKGKGELQTFWLNARSSQSIATRSTKSSSASRDDSAHPISPVKGSSLLEINTKIEEEDFLELQKKLNERLTI